MTLRDKIADTIRKRLAWQGHVATDAAAEAILALIRAHMTSDEAVERACRKAIVGGSFDSLNFAQQERAMTHMSAAILAALEGDQA
jgi:hypothetical protein